MKSIVEDEENLTVLFSPSQSFQKTKYPGFGRRKKKKVKKCCFYGERELASKKPLLSPIPEIPELFSSVSSPSSPLLTGNLVFSFALLCSFCSFISSYTHKIFFFFLLLITFVIESVGSNQLINPVSVGLQCKSDKNSPLPFGY